MGIVAYILCSLLTNPQNCLKPTLAGAGVGGGGLVDPPPQTF